MRSAFTDRCYLNFVPLFLVQKLVSILTGAMYCFNIVLTVRTQKIIELAYQSDHPDKEKSYT